MKTTPDCGYRRVLLAKAPLKVKLEALQKMAHPSARLLTRLIRDRGTPAKVRLLASNRLAELHRQREVSRILLAETNRLERKI